MGNNFVKDWKNKRIFKIENDRFKPKKYIYNSFVNTNCSGFNNKNIYPYLFTDIYSKYYRMNGYNVMYPVGFNNINESSFQYSKQRSSSFDMLSLTYKHQLEDMGVGYDIEKEMTLTDNNFISFVQNVFLKLYNEKYIYFKKKEIFTDFSSKIFYNKYEIYSERNKYYLKNTKEEVYIRNEEVLVLNVKSIQDKFMPYLESIDIDKEVRNEVMKFFEFKECLKLNFLSMDNTLNLDIKLDNPEYLAGINFIALNPKYIDVIKYTSMDELETVTKYVELGDINFDCYTGIILKNPLNNEDIYMFASYKYDTDIHVGIPSVYEDDYMFASTVGINIVDILEEDFIINSDFLTGLKIDEANREIIDTFISEEMGEIYYKSSLDEIVISSHEEFGILVPLLINDDEKRVLDEDYLPVYYSNRYKIVISNEENLVFNGVISKMVFNQVFVLGLTNIYAKIYDNKMTGNDFFKSNEGLSFEDSITVINSNYIEEVAMPIIFNLLFENKLEYKILNKVLCLRGLELSQTIEEEYQRLNISFVDEIINKHSSDAYRLYLLSSDELDDDLGRTFNYLDEFEFFLDQIKNIYHGEFKIDVYENIDWFNFIKEQNELLENFDVRNYTKNLIKFFNGYIRNEGITIVQANKFLVMLSIICPLISEEIYKEVFINKYSIFYSEWPK